MERILVLLHTEVDGGLHKSALEAVSAARELSAALGTTFTVALAGGETQTAANILAHSGAARFLALSGAEYAQPRYATDSAAFEALARAASATIILAPHTSRTARALPGVAHRLGGCVDTHIAKVGADGGSLGVTRWFYRQRIEGTFGRAQRPWVLLLDAGAAPAFSADRGTAQVESVAVSLPALRTTVSGVRAPKSSQQTIRPEASLLFVAGAGWTKKQADGQTHGKQAEELILDFLAQSQASLGGSKSLVDQSGEGQAVLGFMTHLNQVGQTGATPRHPKGLSTCCHGEEPHVVGWRFVHQRRAINLDANCGWARGKADVVYVADAFAVMRRVNELLAAKKMAATAV